MTQALRTRGTKTKSFAWPVIGTELDERNGCICTGFNAALTVMGWRVGIFTPWPTAVGASWVRKITARLCGDCRSYFGTVRSPADMLLESAGQP
jgi:hypothetical protein